MIKILWIGIYFPFTIYKTPRIFNNTYKLSEIILFYPIFIINLKLGKIFKKNKENKLEKQSNATTAEKYKLWKYDYFRDRDHLAMEEITKQLRKQRTKTKSTSLKSQSKSISKPIGKPPNKQNSKPISKPISKSASKPQSGVSRSKYRR